MSSITTRTNAQHAWWIRFLTHDYCPSVNPYVYWLKEPVGWFVLAMAASLLVGAYLSPIGWSLAAGLACIVAVGLVFPWISVRVIRCEIVSETDEFQEGESGHVQLKIANCAPFPLYGLMIRGFLVQPESSSKSHTLDGLEEGSAGFPSGDFGLSGVPWLSRASFRLPITPQFRGRYPKQKPEIACSFPFGLWTARRSIENVQNIMVHPKRLGLCGLMDQRGRVTGDTGYGERTGGHGDFLGVRPFRRGDAIRSVHWQHTARLESLVVCERGNPERIEWLLRLDPRTVPGSMRQNREHLAWRVRVAASLATLLLHQNIECRLEILGESQWQSEIVNASSVTQRKTLRQTYDRLADIPLDGIALVDDVIPMHSPLLGLIQIAPADTVDCSRQHRRPDQCFALSATLPGNHSRSSQQVRTALIDLEHDVASQVNHWMRRFEYGTHVA